MTPSSHGEFQAMAAVPVATGSISVYEKFLAQVRGLLGGVQAQDYVSAHPGQHLWADWGDCKACGFCGTVRWRHADTSECPGLTTLGVR